MTAEPTFTTVPATSLPEMGFLGRRSPVAIRIAYGLPVIRCSVPRSSPAAWTLMSTSLSPGSGTATSSTRRTSEVPYLFWMTAFMVTS